MKIPYWWKFVHRICLTENCYGLAKVEPISNLSLSLSLEPCHYVLSNHRRCCASESETKSFDHQPHHMGFEPNKNARNISRKSVGHRICRCLTIYSILYLKICLVNLTFYSFALHLNKPKEAILIWTGPLNVHEYFFVLDLLR